LKYVIYSTLAFAYFYLCIWVFNHGQVGIGIGLAVVGILSVAYKVTKIIKKHSVTKKERSMSTKLEFENTGRGVIEVADKLFLQTPQAKEYLLALLREKGYSIYDYRQNKIIWRASLR